MKKTIGIIVVLLVAQISFSQELPARLDTLITAYARLHKFNGAALVAKNGTVLLDKGYGLRSAADKTPPRSCSTHRNRDRTQARPASC